MYKSTGLILLSLCFVIKGALNKVPVYDSYDQKYYNRAQKINQSVGIAIVAYNRPQYLKQLIQTLEQNPEAQTLPFYFILDGGPRATQEENCAVINNSSLRYKEIILRKRNYGCAKTQIDALRFMFDWCNFNKAIIMEEDLIVTPSHIRLMLSLDSWAQKNYCNVGAVQCFNFCKLSRSQKEKLLDYIEPSGNHYWMFYSYCLNKAVWNDIKSTLYTYEASFIDPIPYTEEFAKARSKPGFIYEKEIRGWVKDLVKAQSSIKRKGKKTFKDIPKCNLRSKFLSGRFDTCQDYIIGFALWLAGYIKIRTVVNRGKHIGVIGISHDQQLYMQWQEHKVNLDYFPEDNLITTFQVNKRDRPGSFIYEIIPKACLAIRQYM